jgi:hypothetical protein
MNPAMVRAVSLTQGDSDSFKNRKHRAARRRPHDSLNPFSQFDFGLLAGLRYARNWQARERR